MTDLIEQLRILSRTNSSICGVAADEIERLRALTEWQPIETAPKDDTEIIVGVDIATVWIVRSASWSDGEFWEMQKFDSQDEVRGWWSYSNSVGQDKLEGIYEPTHWTPLPDTGDSE